MEKLVIVKRPTRLDSLIEKFNTKGQAKFYIEHLGSDFSDYQSEHDTYYKELDKLTSELDEFGQIQLLDWKYLPSYLFGANDLVFTIGQDGLVANTLKYLDSQLLIGINSDKSRWDGVLSVFSTSDAKKTTSKALNKQAKIQEITKAKIELSDNQILYAVNDFFVGVNNHSSARYEIFYEGKREYQSSSGIIISTPLGSSGWMRSIIEGASSISSSLNSGKSTAAQMAATKWNDNLLHFAVREPFPSKATKTSIVFGEVSPGSPLYIESKMGERGIIFSDGVQNDFLNFNYSVKAKISIAEKKGKLVIG